MKRPESIIGRLTRSLALVASAGALLLLVFIWFEYQISLGHIWDMVAFRQSAYELAEHVVLPMIVLVMPMALAGRWAIRQAVKPLEAAAERINQASGQARGVRIDVTTLPVETVPFADSVNHLLDRIDHAAGMHEAFAADVAHELRTPLTSLSLELERLDSPAAQSMRADVVAMRRLIDQLMLFAQIEAEEAAHLPPYDVDLVDIAADVAAQMAPAAIADGRLVELKGKEAGTVRGRREAIAAALRNLVENALRVTPAGTPVVILADRPAELGVRDGGPGLSKERLEILRKRLQRADHASRDGAGLGLSIVARIMAAHGGELATNEARRELRLIFKKN